MVSFSTASVSHLFTRGDQQTHKTLPEPFADEAGKHVICKIPRSYFCIYALVRTRGKEELQGKFLHVKDYYPTLEKIKKHCCCKSAILSALLSCET